jgi:predicted RNase H-like HicB family nuclease
MVKYSIIIEKVGNNYSAYFPDVPGCVATGDTINEVKDNLKKALETHLRGLMEDGLPIPKAESQVDYITI